MYKYSILHIFNLNPNPIAEATEFNWIWFGLVGV